MTPSLSTSKIPAQRPAAGASDDTWNELVAAMRAKFPGQVDASGSTAIRVNANSARVDADVVPCFDYRYYFSPTSWREGAMVIKKDGARIKNYSDLQLKNGRAKNNATSGFFKQSVRIMKRVENAMVDAKYHREVPSYLVECLVYNVPNEILLRDTWEATIKGVIYHIYSQLQGDAEPANKFRWLEVNEGKYLFKGGQSWSRKDGRDFAYAAWNHLGLRA